VNADLKQITREAVRAAGGPTKLADRIRESGKPTCTRQAISLWVRVPDIYVLLVEREGKFKYSRHQIRPDIFGTAPDSHVQGTLALT